MKHSYLKARDYYDYRFSYWLSFGTKAFVQLLSVCREVKTKSVQLFSQFLVLRQKTCRMSSVGSPKKIANNGRDIPSRRIVVNDMSQLPYDYSSTPGGTLFSTTPGGTRIVYDRSFLMHLRNSPMAKSPPINLPTIPGVTSPMAGKENKPKPRPSVSPLTTNDLKAKPSTAVPSTGGPTDEPQFDMDM